MSEQVKGSETSEAMQAMIVGDAADAGANSPAVRTAGDVAHLTRGYWYGSKMEPDEYTMIWDQFSE